MRRLCQISEKPLLPVSNTGFEMVKDTTDYCRGLLNAFLSYTPLLAQTPCFKSSLLQVGFSLSDSKICFVSLKLI